VDTMLRALRIPTEKLKDKEIESVKERVTCLKWELGYTPAIEDIKTAIVKGFSHELGVKFTEGVLSQKEEKLLVETIPKFKSVKWVDNIRRSPLQRQELKSLYKNEGGLIRTSVILDGYTERILTILITGDFFVYPKNAIFDLENLLRDVPADFNQILSIISRFFGEKQVKIPGLTPKDFTIAIWDAVKKKDLLDHGICLKDINSVYMVGGDFEQVENATVLLLPYCAKKVSCKYRFWEGCVQCGGCTIGPAFKLALDYGLQPVTIQNYEMLEETLKDLQKRGVQSFVGTCCEAFYAKHKDDFERIGLPGVLVDVKNSTCYDLGKEKEAKEGMFENQTELKLDLLKQIVDLKASRVNSSMVGGNQ